MRFLGFFLCLVGLEIHSVASEGSWYSYNVLDFPNPGACAHDMVMDQRGYPVVAFLQEGGCPGPYLATWSVDRWVVEPVLDRCLDSFRCDSNDVGYPQVHLALDSLNHPHVALNTFVENAQYSKKEDSGWYHESVSTYAVPCSIAVDKAGQPHMALLKSSPPQAGDLSYDLFYSSRTNAWHTAKVTTWDNEIFRPTLALDSSCRPYFALYVNTKMRIYREVNGSFSPLFSASGQVGGRAGLAVDSSDQIHVVFSGRDNPRSWTYARGPAFTPEYLATGEEWLHEPAMALARDGTLRLAALPTGDSVWYGQGDFPSTVVDRIPVFLNTWFGLNLGLGKEDRPYLLTHDVSPLDPANFTLRLFSKNPPSATLRLNFRNQDSLAWGWDPAPSSSVIGYRIRRSSDGVNWSGLLPPEASSWTISGLPPNSRCNVRLETISPGFVITSPEVSVFTFPRSPVTLTLGRSPSTSFSAAWSANGNDPGTLYRLDFALPDGAAFSSQTTGIGYRLPLLNPSFPYALNVTAVSGDGEEASLARTAAVSINERGILYSFGLNDATLEALVPGVPPMFRPVLAAEEAGEFPDIREFSMAPTGRGFRLVSDQPLPAAQSMIVTLTRIEDQPLVMEGTPVLARYDEARKQWVPLLTQNQGRCLTAKVDGFGLFQITVRAMATEPLSEFSVYPNPFSAGSGESMVLREVPPGAAVKIYTPGGRHIQTLSGNPTGILEWDGRDEKGNPVRSGTYIFRFEWNGGKKNVRVLVER